MFSWWPFICIFLMALVSAMCFYMQIQVANAVGRIERLEMRVRELEIYLARGDHLRQQTTPKDFGSYHGYDRRFRAFIEAGNQHSEPYRSQEDRSGSS